MNQFLFIVEPYLSGVRIDTFLARQLRNYTPWRLHRMVCAGLVWVNGVTAEPDHRVYRDERVAIRLVEPPDKLLPPSDDAFAIVYEDPWLIVVNKPAGLIVHPVGNFRGGTLINSLQRHLDSQAKFKGLLRPGIVHRLDRMTSGLLVVTKDHLSHRLLSIDFQRGRPTKTYHALVEGCPTFERLTIDLPIGQHPGGDSILMSARPDARRPRHAKTEAMVKARHGTHSLIECRLLTGRNHQIRVHLAAVGHPVLGDEYYAANGCIRRPSEIEDTEPERRHALHACQLTFQHPILQMPLTFNAPPPNDFWELADVN
ncbi:RluA family pseudouridine synthase [Fuerstiella marisgermanici]|uniref:Pseudouridine synthase n=1 Tax=Fuerstiella marisgermanici TaxID=1891926 RepID=A0A1P8WA19_9PLAN|nr:RluA family pseudouridine synthase [Fuerstiella marisgermanici]APZ90899.1 Ribosomal large subunit pseudouridine synthase D [Fuerstiella marisgermanici]